MLLLHSIGLDSISTGRATRCSNKIYLFRCAHKNAIERAIIISCVRPSCLLAAAKLTRAPRSDQDPRLPDSNRAGERLFAPGKQTRRRKQARPLAHAAAEYKSNCAHGEHTIGYSAQSPLFACPSSLFAANKRANLATFRARNDARRAGAPVAVARASLHLDCDPLGKLSIAVPYSGRLMMIRLFVSVRARAESAPTGSAGARLKSHSPLACVRALLAFVYHCWLVIWLLLLRSRSRIMFHIGRVHNRPSDTRASRRPVLHGLDSGRLMRRTGPRPSFLGADQPPASNGHLRAPRPDSAPLGRPASPGCGANSLAPPAPFRGAATSGPTRRMKLPAEAAETRTFASPVHVAS